MNQSGERILSSHIIIDHVDKIAHSTEQSLLHGLRQYVNSTRETACSTVAYTMVQAVVDATEIIKYVESGLTGHLNDAQTFGLMRRIGTELCFT